MTRDEALQRVDDLKGFLPNEEALFEFKGEIEELYSIVIGEELAPCNCRNRLCDALITIYSYLKNHDKMRTEIKSRLKRGVLIHYNGEMYTNANLTDEVAIAYVRDFPQNEKFFEAVAEAPAEEEKVVAAPKKKARKSSKSEE